MNAFYGPEVTNGRREPLERIPSTRMNDWSRLKGHIWCNGVASKCLCFNLRELVSSYQTQSNLSRYHQPHPHPIPVGCWYCYSLWCWSKVPLLADSTQLTKQRERRIARRDGALDCLCGWMDVEIILWIVLRSQTFSSK